MELASKKGPETGLVPSEVDPATGEMVFVFTDIMNSTGLRVAVLPVCSQIGLCVIRGTAIDCNIVATVARRCCCFAEAAAANPKCMNNVQQVHDFVIRESLSKNSGFEIGTQGDAFECAFVSVVDAVNFALEVRFCIVLESRLHPSADSEVAPP